MTNADCHSSVPAGPGGLEKNNDAGSRPTDTLAGRDTALDRLLIRPRWRCLRQLHSKRQAIHDEHAGHFSSTQAEWVRGTRRPDHPSGELTGRFAIHDGLAVTVVTMPLSAHR
jgi:hypothetical protein